MQRGTNPQDIPQNFAGGGVASPGYGLSPGRGAPMFNQAMTSFPGPVYGGGVPPGYYYGSTSSAPQYQQCPPGMGYPPGAAAYGAAPPNMQSAAGVGTGARPQIQDAELMAEYARQRAAVAAATGPRPFGLGGNGAPGPAGSNGRGVVAAGGSQADITGGTRSMAHSLVARATGGRDAQQESAEMSDQGEGEEGYNEGGGSNGAPLAMRWTRRNGTRVAQRRASHNAIELRRSRRIQQAIKELQDLLEAEGVVKKRDKASILATTVEYIRRVQEEKSDRVKSLLSVGSEGVPLGISYETIFQFAAVPIAIADAGGRLRDANRMFYHLFLPGPYGSLPTGDSPARMIFHDCRPEERKKGLSVLHTLAQHSSVAPGVSVVVVSKQTRFGVAANFRVSLAPITEAGTASRATRVPADPAETTSAVSVAIVADAEGNGEEAASSLRAEAAARPAAAEAPADAPRLVYCVFHPLEKEEELWRKAFGDESIIHVDANGHVVQESDGTAATAAPAEGGSEAQGDAASEAAAADTPATASAATPAAPSDAAPRTRAGSGWRKRRSQKAGAADGGEEEMEEKEEEEAAAASGAAGDAPAKRTRRA